MPTNPAYVDSAVYGDVPETYIVGLRLVQKAKKCGKENCEKCPHKGFWYLIAKPEESATHKRTEIYLGRSWNERTLLDLQPRLSRVVWQSLREACQSSVAARERDRLLAEIESLSMMVAELATERDHAVMWANETCRRAIAVAESEYRREAGAVGVRLKEAQVALGKLRKGGA